MSDFEKLYQAERMLLKAKTDYINEFSDFVNCMKACNPEDLKRAQYLHGKADAICAAYIIVRNLLENE